MCPNKQLPTNRQYPRWVPVTAVVLVLVVLPLLIFGAVEIGLRLGGYGVPSDLFVETGIPNHYTLHSEYHLLFHPRTVASSEDALSQNRPLLMEHPKPDNVFRIFVLGGSTAHGFPYKSQHSFPSVAGNMVNSQLENQRVEIVNLGRSAMSSYYVREVSRHIWQWDPDLVLVYSGHNEYFGTIGAGSGRGHRSKILYMRLKRFRTFQLLFNLFNTEAGDRDSADQPMTLMAERLADGVFPRDDNFDRVVAERFIDNLEMVRRSAARRNIPVMVMDPVSNLIDMPPFDGEFAAQLTDLIELGVDSLIHNQGDIEAWRSAVADESLRNQNAHLLYLQALDESQENAVPMDTFVLAKDADTIPFRARETLRTALREWSVQHSDTVLYIPVQEEMLDMLGPTAFSDTYFIDHLHFSHQGQMLIGRITADYIARATVDTLGVSPGNWPSDRNIRPHMHYHPAHEVMAVITMRRLLRNPPFKDMLIPYQGLAVQAAMRENPHLQDDQLRPLLLSRSAENALQIIGENFYQNQQWEAFVQFLNALVYISPANYESHYHLARFLKSIDVFSPQVLRVYQRAYLLSERDRNIRQEMHTYAEKAGYLQQHAQFMRQIEE